MPSGFMPVVIDLQPSVKVTIPWDKPKVHSMQDPLFFVIVLSPKDGARARKMWRLAHGFTSERARYASGYQADRGLYCGSSCKLICCCA